MDLAKAIFVLGSSLAGLAINDEAAELASAMLDPNTEGGDESVRLDLCLTSRRDN